MGNSDKMSMATEQLIKMSDPCKGEKLLDDDDEAYLIRRWFSIFLSWITIFVSLLQFSMYSSITAPFLESLDPSTTKDFATWAICAFSLGQMVTPPLFGLWSNKIKSCKLPICVGLVIEIIACILYCSVQAFPLHTRKWMVLAIRVLAGLGCGVVSVPRNYCATASTKSERPKAVSGSTAALGLSVIAGPGFQALFGFVGYPGVYISSFHLHEYNAPAFASGIMFLILLILNATLLLERYPGLSVATNDNEKNDNKFPLPKYDKIGAWASVWCWFAIWVALTNFVIVGVPFSQSQFDWTLTKAIFYNGCIFGAFAATSLSAYVLYAFCSFRVNDRTAIMIGSTLILIFYLVTFPYPFYPSPNSDGNATLLNSTLNETVVCAYTKAAWCFEMPRIPVMLYFSGFTLMAIGFPVANSALSILLAKILGPRRQGTMQGVYITTGGLARTLGPLVISLIFNRYGPQMSWTLSICIIGSGILCAIIFKKNLVPLLPNPKSKPGERYACKYGKLHPI